MEGTAKLKDWVLFCFESVVNGGTVTFVHRYDRKDELISLVKNYGTVAVLPLWPKIYGIGAKRVLVQVIKGASPVMYEQKWYSATYKSKWLYPRSSSDIARSKSINNISGLATMLVKAYFMLMIKKYLEKWRIPGFRNPKPVVAIVRLSGVIADRSGVGRSGISAVNLVSVLESAFNLPHLKAVALSINSPGGSPVQSSLIGKTY